MKKKKRMIPHPLTDRQREAVRMMFLESAKVQDVAAALGVHRCTVWRWSRYPEWDREWKRIQREWEREYKTRQRQAMRHQSKQAAKEEAKRREHALRMQVEAAGNDADDELKNAWFSAYLVAKYW